MYVWGVCECVQSSKSKEEDLPYKNFKRELGIPLVSFTLSRPLVMMISIHSFSENTFFLCLLLFNRGASLYLSLNSLLLQANYN